MCDRVCVCIKTKSIHHNVTLYTCVHDCVGTFPRFRKPGFLHLPSQKARRFEELSTSFQTLDSSKRRSTPICCTCGVSFYIQLVAGDEPAISCQVEPVAWRCPQLGRAGEPPIPDCHQAAALQCLMPSAPNDASGGTS